MKKIDSVMRLRIVMAVVGVCLTGVSIAFFKRSFFGVDPFQCFANGVANVSPLRFGTVSALINAVLLVVVLFMNKHYIGLSTFINLFLLGYIIEFLEGVLANACGELGLAMRIVFLAIGIVIACIAAALYYTADLGVSTYDAIPLHIASRKPKLFGRVVPFKVVRIIADCICTAIGAILGFLPGIGTIITALFMGPLITFFRNTLSDPMLERAKAKAA